MEMSYRGRINHFVSNLPNWLLALTMGAPLIAGFIGYIWKVPYYPSSVRLYLGALAGAQASVLAIVFSVTVLGIQLIANRYSPRLISVFYEVPIFRFTFGIFVISTAAHLALLASAPSEPTPLFHALVWAASGLSLAVVGTLYVFIVTTMERSTPDGIISSYIDRISVSKFVEDTETYAENNGPHPTQPLYELSMSAITEREWATAREGIQGISNLLTRVVIEADVGVLDPQRNQDWSHSQRDIFTPAFSEYLPEIAVHASEKEETGLINEAISSIRRPGVVAAENDKSYITNLAGSGLSQAVRDSSEDWNGNRVRGAAFQAYTQLVVQTASLDDLRYFQSLLISLNGALEHWYYRNLEFAMYESMFRPTISDTFPKTLTALIEAHDDELAEFDPDWNNDHPSQSMEGVSPVDEFFAWRRGLVDVSEKIIAMENDGQYPLAIGTFRTRWQEMVVESVDSEATDFGLSLCKAMIELAYVDWREGDSKGTTNRWAREVAMVMNEGNAESVRNALSELANEGRPMIVRQHSYIRSMESQPSFIERLSARIRGTGGGFSEWLEEFNDDVEENYEAIKG